MTVEIGLVHGIQHRRHYRKGRIHTLPCQRKCPWPNGGDREEPLGSLDKVRDTADILANLVQMPSLPSPCDPWSRDSNRQRVFSGNENAPERL